MQHCWPCKAHHNAAQQEGQAAFAGLALLSNTPATLPHLVAAGGSQSKRYDDDFDTLAKPREEAKVEKTDFGGRSAAGMLSADEVHSHV